MRSRLPPLLLAFLFGLILTACDAPAPAPTKPEVNLSAVVSPSQTPTANVTSTSELVVQTSRATKVSPTKTNPVRLTKTATETPIAKLNRTLTAWAKPLPTIIPTQTFDARSIRRNTPEPAAQCPHIKSELPVPTLEYDGQARAGVPSLVFTDYLNNFGKEAFLLADRRTRGYNGHLDPHIILQRDLTNDDVPEIVVTYGSLYIFGCKDGKYVPLLETEFDVRGARQNIEGIYDLNQNGSPELLIFLGYGPQGIKYYGFYEWGNGKFNNLFRWNDASENEEGIEISVLLGGEFRLQDINGDGLKEIALHEGNFWPTSSEALSSSPWRGRIYYFQWNGRHFALSKKVYDPPSYRFQAVVDADYAVLRQEYDQAQNLYQQAIFNDKLEWWSEERKEYLFYYGPRWGDTPSQMPTSPDPDPNEYIYLSAYARFRIMVLNLLRNDEPRAQVTYQALQKDFPTGTPGSIYASMATAFWQAYQATHDPGLACGNARAVAIEHEEEATRYLLDDYIKGGWSVVRYTIGQLCPFQ